MSTESSIAGRKLIYYIVVIPIIVTGFFIVVWIVSSNKSSISEIHAGVEDYLVLQRFLNSPSCFAFVDNDLKRVSSWMIDLSKFTQENLEKCYNADSTRVNAYRITLSYNDQKVVISTKNWEGFFKKAETRRIYLYNNNKIQKAELFIEMQNAK